MNQVFRKAAQKCLTPVYHRMDVANISSLRPMLSLTGTLSGSCNPSTVTGLGNVVNTVVPHRTIQFYERKLRLVLRARRAKEQFNNPKKLLPTPRYNYADWNYKAELFAFGSRLSEQFDDVVLREALTDQSYINKELKKQEELGIDTTGLDIKSNQELTELGRQIAEDVLYKFLRKEVPLFPDIGHSALVKHLTSMKTMSEVGSNLGMKDLILCEEYPPTDETYSNAMFAVIGAVSKSSSGERAEKFVIDFIASLLCGKDINEIWDIPRPWLMMEEIAKEKKLVPVEPRLIREAGRNTVHAVFVVGVYDKDKTLLGTGIGETVDIAQEMAARDVLKGFFNTREPRAPFEFQKANIPYRLVPHVRNISQSY